MKELILKLEKERVYLAESVSLPTRVLGLDRSVSVFKPETYWKVRIVRYFEREKRLAVQVISYHGSRGAFENQPPFPFEVHTVSFLSVCTDHLLRCTERIAPPVPKPAPAPVSKKPPQSMRPEVEEKIPPPPVLKSTTREIQSAFTVAIDDLKFDRGTIRFTAHIKEIARDMDIHLQHASARPELSSITELLKRVLGKDSINGTVTLTITERPGGFIEQAGVLRAKSPDIKHFACEEVGRALEKKKVEEYVAGLCETARETRAEITAFSDVYTDFSVKMLSEKQCLDTIFDKSTIHSSHLQYLSNRHAFDIFNLRTAARPFSFLFLVEGQARCHFVLEVHSVELATYVWHVDKDRSALRKKYREIEPVIQSFEGPNRERYLRTKPADFSRISHDYTPDESGFERWKKRLEKVLI